MRVTKVYRIREMDIHNILKKNPILPVIVLDKYEHALPLADALMEGGITTLEITLRTPVALEAIELLKSKMPECIVGAGTVVKPAQFFEIKQAGADFAVSPGISSELIERAEKENIPYLPAIATPSEILLAIQHKLSLLKFFPAGLNGGVAALRNFMSVFPAIRFCPTGGIDQGNMMDYFSLKNVICVGGSWLAPKNLVESHRWNAITELAQKAIKTLNN